jgi:DNA-binding response OmpR family regulator
MSVSRKKPGPPVGTISRRDGQARIFIVEDEIVIVRGLEDALARLGYQVSGFALSAEEALPAIVAHKPDLVLVDIYLKGAMDGIQLANLLLDSHAIPVIYLTAYSNEEVLGRAKSTAPYGYIVKPFRERQLKVNIELALARRREEQERKIFLTSCQHTIAELEQQLGVARSELETAAEKLQVQDMKLDQLRQEVQEINQALLSLTRHIARTREELEMEVAVAVRTRVLPILKQLQGDPGFKQYRLEFEMLSMHMGHLASRPGKKSGLCLRPVRHRTAHRRAHQKRPHQRPDSRPTVPFPGNRQDPPPQHQEKAGPPALQPKSRHLPQGPVAASGSLTV